MDVDLNGRGRRVGGGVERGRVREDFEGEGEERPGLGSRMARDGDPQAGDRVGEIVGEGENVGGVLEGAEGNTGGGVMGGEGGDQ